MKHSNRKNEAIVALIGLVTAMGAGRAIAATTGDLVARVEHVTPGGHQFQVTDRHGARMQVVRPARPSQAVALERDGDLVNASALQAGDTVLLTGVGYRGWFEASRVQILGGGRLGAATTAPVLRFEGFAGARELRAVSADGVEYRIVFPPRPQVIPIWREGSLAELSALREGDRIVAHGVATDGLIRADRVEVLDESRLGRVAGGPFRLTYRGSAGWRRLIGEAADGARYAVVLPRRLQAVYFVREGMLVEPSSLHSGDTIEVRGVVRGDEIEASAVTIR